MINGAEIQVENGNYSRIHNAILEAIYGGDFTARELKCLLFLLRKTYGYSKKSDAISYEQFAAATGIARRHVMATMQGLASRNVVIVESNGQNRPQSWTFNKYIEQWQLVTESVTSKAAKTSDQNSHQNNKLVTKTVTTLVTESVTTTSDQNSHPQKKEKKKKNNISSPPADDGDKKLTPQQEYFGAVCTLVGIDYRIITKEQTGQVAQAVGKLQHAGYSIDDLRAFWVHWKHNDWRGKQGQWPTLKQLLAEIGKVKVSGMVGMTGAEGNMNGGMVLSTFNGSEK